MVKQKNKRLLARLGSLIGVLLLMCCMILPASAASGSSPVWYSVLPLDGVRLMESSSSYVDLPWVADVWLSDAVDSDVTSGDGGYGVTNSSLSISNEQANFDVAFSRQLSAYNSLVFYADEAIIKTRDLRDANFSVFFGFDGGYSARVSISFAAVRMTQVGTSYQPQWKNFSNTFRVSSGDNIMALISSMLTDGNYVPSDQVYLSDLEIAFTDFGNDDQWISFNVDLRQSRPTVYQWLNQYKMPYENKIVYEKVEGGFSFDWLINAVNSILSIELWPSFSIGGLLRVVFVVGLLFWFLRVTI